MSVGESAEKKEPSPGQRDNTRVSVFALNLNLMHLG